MNRSINDDMPECDCSKTSLPDNPKSHHRDCIAVRWVRDVIKETDNNLKEEAGIPPGNGFIATPDMRDIQELRSAIEALQDKILELEDKIDQLKNEVRYG